MTAVAAAARRWAPSDRALRWLIKPAVFLAALGPLAYLVYGAWAGALGANPIETVIRTTGQWTLRFLWLTLAVTPLRQLFGWHWLQRLRRMLGLFAFFYAVLHFFSYIGLDQFFAWEEILGDLAKRPYATVGFTALLLMVPLAATSTNAMMRRLGRRWQALHRWVYLVAVAAMLHYFWQVKADIGEPLIYLALLFAFFLYRLQRLLADAGAGVARRAG